MLKEVGPVLKNVSEMRKNHQLNIFKPNQIYKCYRVVEEYKIFLPPNCLIIYPDKKISDNDKYY